MIDVNKIEKRYIVLFEISVAIIATIIILFDFISLVDVISTFLIFMIILEVMRMVKEFIHSHKVKLTLVIDSFIMFFIRDIVLVASSEKYSFNEQVSKTVFFLVIILMFFIFRIMALRYSPNDKNCETCPAIDQRFTNMSKNFFKNNKG